MSPLVALPYLLKFSGHEKGEEARQTKVYLEKRNGTGFGEAMVARLFRVGHWEGQREDRELDREKRTLELCRRSADVCTRVSKLPSGWGKTHLKGATTPEQPSKLTRGWELSLSYQPDWKTG